MTARNPVEFTKYDSVTKTAYRVGNQVEVVNGSDPIFVGLGDSASIDAFARLRVSNPYTLFDSKQIWNDPDIADNLENYPLFWDNQETSGSGTTTTFDVNRASTTLAVASTTAGKRIRQTKQHFNYQPGKSQLFLLTGILGVHVSGVTKRVGLFDDDNGLFFESDGTDLKVVRRSNVTASPVDTSVSQNNWNIDKLDGTGSSGLTIDLTKTQIFLIDFEWLGVGRVRLGIVIDGIPIYCHEFLNANTLDVVYMSTPNLPIRVSIENDGTGTADTLEHICCSVISEGGIQPNGILRFADIGITTAEDISATTPGTIYAICGIRLKTAYLSADVREVAVSVIEDSGANNPFIWRLHINPTLTTGITYSDVANSAIQYGAALPAGDVITDSGIVIAGGYQARQDANANVSLESALRLGSLIDGTRDELILSASPATNNNLFFGGLSWQEAW